MFANPSPPPTYCDYCRMAIRSSLRSLVAGPYVFCAACLGQAVIESERSDRPPSVSEALRYLVSLADSRALAHAESDAESDARDMAMRERRR